ncbi:DUF5723 family protein [Maribacter chungangensis]|uniref:DUF5723 family protein n=1 Tax=Maribacter chungangensis TaxID=1069117 RepID=A0ABW3B309_9FLAO
MKQYLLSISLVLLGYGLHAQSYIGFLTDNYSGVHGVIDNPANITDSRFKTDINLLGASAFFSNDYYGVNINDAIGNSDFDFDLDGTKTPTENNNLYGNTDILGPAVMFNLSPKSSIALFTRARIAFNVNEINGNTIDNLADGFDENQDFLINEGNAFATANGWTEYGFTYARTLVVKDQHFLKGGISLKYLQGIGNTFASGTDVNIAYDADGTSLPGGQTTGSLTSTGEVMYGSSDNISDDFDDFDIQSLNNATGFGADVGFVYEWRPDHADYNGVDPNGNSTAKHLNKYKLKIGLSISDIGSINYKDSTQETYDINATVSEDDIENEDSIEDILNNLYTQTSTATASKAILPTAMRLSADYNLHKKFYINLNTNLPLTSGNKINVNRIPATLGLTPRFETKWFSFYLPLSVIKDAGTQLGAGLRAGPLYIGSGSILSALTSNTSRAADVYAGVKIPIYQPTPKDKDGDGVLNKFDDCPKEFGDPENNGCPWKDTDGDTILDKDDACINEAGPTENNGCPWGDADGDGILDNEDTCPNEKGPLENNGCPWKDTDGDGILDKDDACINEAGTVANKGCPEPEPIVTEEVQKTLNEYAKTILFTTGKSTLKEESTGVLTDIIMILNEYPTANFTVEGHTDSIGSRITNQKLSEERANAVKTFLIENGIAATRLTSVGYGEDKPIADNMYKAGRSQNRRVEINLVK